MELGLFIFSGSSLIRTTNRAAPKLDIAAVNELSGPHGRVIVIVRYEGATAGEMAVFAHHVGPVLCHSVGLVGPAQLTGNPALHGAGFDGVGHHQPCFNVVTLQALKGTLFEPVSVGHGRSGHHAHLALGTTRTVDRQ
jgi:hypothetical protein